MTDPATPRRPCILAVPGSLRADGFSTAILKTLAERSAHEAEYEFAAIGDLPHFNQDLYIDPLPRAVEHFRQQIAWADGLVISSPEYNHGIPGVLKNALDWASRPHNGSPLRGKPVLIMTCSPAFTGGVRAQYQIRETVVSALARPVATPEIVVGGVAAKVVDGKLVDEASIAFALDGFMMMLADIAGAAPRPTFLQADRLDSLAAEVGSGGVPHR